MKRTRINTNAEYRHLIAKAKRMELTEQEKKFIADYEEYKECKEALAKLTKRIEGLYNDQSQK